MGIIIDDDGVMHKVFTKTDLIAILTEIQMEIEELDTPNNSDAYMTCSGIIQEKIDKLKEA